MAEIISIDIPRDPKKPVTLVVDVSNAVDVSDAEEDGGDARDINDGFLDGPKLSVVIQQSEVDLKDPDLQVLKAQGKKHSVIFKPPEPGLYVMIIKCNGESVSGSPLQLNLTPPNAKQVSLTKPPTGNIKAGESIEIWFDSSLAGRGMFTAVCKGEELGGIPVTVTRHGITSTHKVTFLPPQEDEYSLSVSYSGVSVKGSPYKIDLVPVKANLVKCSQPVFPRGMSGPVEMDICTKGSGNAQLTATCAGSGGDKIPVNIDTVSKDNYHLKLDPPKDDMLTLTVKYGGMDVQGSPFPITVTKSEPSSPKVVEPVEVVVGDKVCYEMDDPLDADVNAGVDADVDASVSADADADADACVDVDTSVDANVDADVDTDVDVNVDTNVDANANVGVDADADVDVYVVNVDAAAPVNVTFGELHIPETVDPPNEVWMNVDCSRAGQSTLTAECKRQNGEETFPISIEEIEPGSKRVKFSPVIPDIYTLTLCLGNEVVPGGIFEINLLPKPCAKLVRHLDTIIPEDVGEPVVLNFDASKAGPGTMRGRVNGVSQAGGVDCEVNLKDEENGIYQLLFVPDGADTYNVDVYWCNESIPGSPIYVNIIYPMEVILSPPVNPQIYHPIRVSADTGKAGLSDLTASCSGSDCGDIDIEIIQVSNAPTMYNIYFHPHIADLYLLRVYFGGFEVKQSPIEIDLSVQIKSPSLESVHKEVIPVHPITKPYLIHYLDQQDNMKGVLAYAVHDDSCTRHILRIRKGNNGKSLLVFYPQNKGLHFIHIKQVPKEIRGSPFKVNITDSNPSACGIVDVPEKSYLNEEVVLKIDASNAGMGDLNILATVPVGGRTAFHHSENGDGIYAIRFTPIVLGRYKIEVQWGDVTIPGSPIFINVFELTDEIRQARDAASKVIILEESQNTFRDKMLHTDGADFYVKTDKACEGKLTLRTQGPANPMIKICEQRSDLYQCEVNPVVSGKYNTTILWNDIPIPNNPFMLDFTADKTYIINDLDLESRHFVLHQPSKFRVNCGENEGTLTVTATPMESAFVEVNLLENNTYLVKMVPQLQGNHELSLKFAGKHVLLSPYHVRFESPKMQQLSNSSTSSASDDSIGVCSDLRVTANGSGLHGGIIGQEGNFSIETRSAVEGKLEISIQGPKGSFKIRVRRHPDNDRVLLARYDPTHIGEYTINILWCEGHVEGSPFVVNIKAQEQSSG